MANRNFTQFFRTLHNYPVLIDCNFVVDHTNGNGLGIRSLKGPGVANVFMNTNQTPGLGNNGVTNPNPAAGTIVVQLQDNYNRIYSGGNAIVSPVSGSALRVDNSELTAGVAYIITTLGDTTPATWATLGVPAGVIPAVGVAFIAASVGAGSDSSTSRVMATADAGSGIFTIETVGNSNLAIGPNRLLQTTGAQFILQCRKDSSSDAPTIAAPADGSVISLTFLLSNSSVLTQGE